MSDEINISRRFYLPKQKRFESFLEKAIEKYGNKYDYRNVDYVNLYEKICILCPTHGKFLQKPINHLLNIGCLQCYRESQNNLNKEKLLAQFKKKYGEKFNYFFGDKINTKEFIKISCPNHGDFYQKPLQHLRNGCSKCNKHERLSLLNSERAKDFFLKAAEYHKEKYDYSLSEYKNKSQKIKIKCPKHGIFEQSPANHLKSGCLKCSRESFRLTTSQFIEKAVERHGDEFDYSKVNYKTSCVKVIIICKKHGEFTQLPSNHLSGDKCLKCQNKINQEKRKRTICQFISESQKIFGVGKYDYSNVSYVNSVKKVELLCLKHQIKFLQAPKKHLVGQNGCPKCQSSGISSQEQLISEFLSSLNVFHTSRVKNIIGRKELDILVSKEKFAIECNGIFWHSEFYSRNKSTRKGRKYHLSKTKECSKIGISLFHFLDIDINNSFRKIKACLKRFLKKKRYFLNTDCNIKEISDEMKSKFLNKYEINSDCKSNFNLGLFYKNRLISVAALQKRNNKIRLVRLSECFNFTFENCYAIVESYIKSLNYNVLEVKLNNNWPRNDIPLSEFAVEKIIQPKDWYWNKNNCKLHSKNQVIKELKNSNLYNNSSLLLNCINNKLDRIWDTGKTIYTKEISCTS